VFLDGTWWWRRMREVWSWTERGGGVECRFPRRLNWNYVDTDPIRDLRNTPSTSPSTSGTPIITSDYTIIRLLEATSAVRPVCLSMGPAAFSQVPSGPFRPHENKFAWLNRSPTCELQTRPPLPGIWAWQCVLRRHYTYRFAERWRNSSLISRAVCLRRSVGLIPHQILRRASALFF
jgi:hypothetical protein